MQTKRVVVIGAGIGGLVAAIDLARRGVAVEIFEAAATPGGKLREVAVGTALLDAGPTVFTMRWVFEEIFADAGADLTDRLPLTSVNLLARHAWSATERLDLYADLEQSVDAIAAFSSPAQAQRYRDFAKRAQGIYQTLETPFLRSQRPNPLSLTQRVGLRKLPDMLRISPFATLWGALGQHFDDPRLRQLFGRYATYCGSSPFMAPATLMLVAHVERCGVWLVQGGMHALAQALARLAGELGVKIHYRQKVASVATAGARCSSVTLASGESISAVAVVFNGDPAALAAGLLGSAISPATRRVATADRSLSAITWNRVARTSGFEPAHHSVFFSKDYAAEFADLRAGRVPSSPTVYVCAQDRDSLAQLPCGVGPERLLCLVNAPALGDRAPISHAELAIAAQASDAVLQHCGLQLEDDSNAPVVTTPSDFEKLFPGTGGALYGQASHGWMASFSRPGARSRVPGLYLAGGSTHPGPGVPMAALSGRLAAASVIEDLAR